MPLRIRRTITVKAIVTEELKARLAAELQSALAQVEAESARLDALGRAAGASGRKTPGDTAQAAGAGAPNGEPAGAERAKRAAQRDHLLGRMRELAKLELGAEIVQGTLEGEADVRLGDEWARMFAAEVVLKDGRVVAIRE
jgi:hypothetical protein